MCGRYALYSSAADLVEVFAIVGELELTPRYNVAPTHQMLVLTEGRRPARMKWGLVPSWSKDGKGWINARADGLFEKPAFRQPARKRRCLVPADGFFEWKKVGKEKVPMLIRAADHRPFAMAGLWEPSREGLPTFAVVTTDACPAVAPVHDRMPVLLDAAGADRWLDPAATVDELVSLLRPRDDVELIEVDPRVNKVAFDDPGCVRPAGAGPLFAR